LLLMSFPSSDVTSTGLDHGQLSGFATFDWPFWSLWSNIRLLQLLIHYTFEIFILNWKLGLHRS
jgi:hypothetical protein